VPTSDDEVIREAITKALPDRMERFVRTALLRGESLKEARHEQASVAKPRIPRQPSRADLLQQGRSVMGILLP
jgi:hypothetical protein